MHPRRSRQPRPSTSGRNPLFRRLAMEQLETRDLLAAFDVLVFSKTAGFRHSSIPAGIAAIQSLGAVNDFVVVATEDANAFTAANLANYEAVVFLNTTGDVLNATQQAAFEQYIQGGGGWVGVHSAADTEYDWSWYGGLFGAIFESHPAIQQVTIKVADHVHPSTVGVPERWVRTDELYDFQAVRAATSTCWQRLTNPPIGRSGRLRSSDCLVPRLQRRSGLVYGSGPHGCLVFRAAFSKALAWGHRVRRGPDSV